MIDDILRENADLTEKRINELLPECNKKYKSAVSAARYSLLNGGKRIRPVILLEFYRLCGGDEKGAVDFAAALEMIHTYSLIHDDLPCMDNDDYRRGKLSCHKAYGETTALLAGDLLLTYAFSVAAGVSDIPADRVLKAISVLAKKAGINGMVGGQVIDLEIEKTGADIDTVKNMYLLKTGALLEAAAVIGCVLAGAGEEKITAAEKYASSVGLAFQIIDDILDSTGDEKLLGKPVGSDEKNSKVTYVSKYGVEKSREIAAGLTTDALTALGAFEGDKSRLTELTEYLLIRKF